MSEGEEEDGFGLGAFVFGNVDPDGQLEEDYVGDPDVLCALAFFNNTDPLAQEKFHQRLAGSAQPGRPGSHGAALNEADDRLVAAALQTRADGADDEFAEFDAPAVVNRIDERFTYRSGAIKWTELLFQERDTRCKKRSAAEQPQDFCCQPPEVVPDERQHYLEMRVKFREQRQTHYRIPLAEDCGVGTVPVLAKALTGKHAEALLPLETCDWESDILWDAPAEKPAKKQLYSVDLDWDESAIIWDDTLPVTVPIPRLVLDHQIEELNLVPRKAPPQPPKAISFSAIPAAISIRKRPATSVVCHSPPAQNLSLVVWQMNEEQARRLHRPRHALSGRGRVQFLGALNLQNSRLQRIQRASDLSAADNLIILLEYTEQNPPVLQNVGMASKLRNYYSQRTVQDEQHDLPEGALGENMSLAPSDVSPFLGRIPPGERMYGIENHLFKAPVFKHSPEPTDFLLIRTSSQQWFLREIPHLFAVGQTLPLQKVPSPSSKTAMAYSRNRLKSFVYTALRRRPTILLSNVKAMFPNETEPAIRTVLKACCTFQRKGKHGQCWVLKTDFDLGAETHAFTPDEVCLHEASQAALVRLQDMGIRRFNNPYALTEAREAIGHMASDVERQALLAIEQEVQVMPWNVTSTFCDVMRGRLRPSIANAESDMNDQFAFAKTRTDSRVQRDSREPEKNKRLADGSDLRTVEISDAKRFLLKAGVTPAQIRAAGKRWSIIGMMRDKATELAEAGSTDAEVLRYARPTIANTNLRQQEFDARSQHIFDRMVRYCSGVAEEDDPELDQFEQELAALMDDAAEEQEEPDESVTGLKRKKQPAKKPAKRKRPAEAEEQAEDEEDEEGEMEALERILAGRVQSFDPGVVVGTLGEARPVASTEKIIKKTSTIYNDDGSLVVRTEFVRDPAQMQYIIRKRRNLEQKRSTIDTLMDDCIPQEDRFYQQLYTYCEKALERLRRECRVGKPKNVWICSYANLENTLSHDNWLAGSLFISIPKLETDASDPVTLGTPSVRCGRHPHSPLYRSYVWRKDRWSRIEGDMAVLLQMLRPRVFSWSCQHRDVPGGPICGAAYLNLPGAITNRKYLSALGVLARDISQKLRCGYFLPKHYVERVFFNEDM